MCISPIVIVYRSRLNKNDDIRIYGQKHSQLVQCGKCDECLRHYQNAWMFRNYMQFRETKFATFFTLTYRDDTVFHTFDDETGKVFNSVCKEHVTVFLKRFREFRRKKGLSTDFKWFVTSEYGPLTLRPHLHGLLHGIHLLEFQEFAIAWRKTYGFTMAREVNLLDQKNAMVSARYVSKYCSKGDFENPLVLLNKVNPTFHLISNGLGASYLNERTKSYHLALDFHPKRDSNGKYTDSYLEEIFRRMLVPIGSFGYSLPRYYREKIFAKCKDLQVAYSDYVLAKYIDEYEDKLAFIQTDKSCRSRYEASVILDSQMSAELDQRKVDSHYSHSKFFKKSKI